ncbi:hypothetical protein V6N13_099662 [Hibiscus sabdariffa]
MRSEVITLFVKNIPEKLHWQGLWFAFGRHGDIVDAFIATKKSKDGKRFGFVRIQDKTNVLEKKKIRRQSYNAEVSPWENANTNPQTNPVSVGGVPIDKSVDKGDPSSMMGRKRKKISGHIESEDLWKWKNCLVGEWIQSAQLVAFTGDLMRGDWV